MIISKLTIDAPFFFGLVVIWNRDNAIALETLLEVHSRPHAAQLPQQSLRCDRLGVLPGRTYPNSKLTEVGFS
jgi:hypothetical protein